MTSIDIHVLLRGLAKKRPVFHSEADFQFALAWEIREARKLDSRLEFRPFADERMYLDIWLPQRGVAVELKYMTRALSGAVSGESFALLNQGAQDLRRYDFLKDIGRLERVGDRLPQAAGGFAVLLTNDSSYWNPPRRETIDAMFRLHEGRELTGRLVWSKRASRGTTKGRESPICLKSSYLCQWRDYGCAISGAEERKHARFRYLALEVSRSTRS